MTIENKRKVKGTGSSWPTAVFEQGISQGTKYIELLFNGSYIMVGATHQNRVLSAWIGYGSFKLSYN